ncbi:MAG TPA: HAMP domain-containing histidine kinase [Candidatus Kaiserbacteria bacterium]|nr:HAMP domain-containing histidine kinase [Candidatus Kaiserbacteria bacterium]
MIYFQIQDKNGQILAGNMQGFSRMEDLQNNKNFSKHNKKGVGIKSVYLEIENISIWIVVENERDMLNSSKIFKKTVNIYKTVALDVAKRHKEQISAHAHVLNTLQGQIRQKIQGFAEDSKFYGDSYSESMSKIVKIIEDNKENAADLICYIQKRVIDMRAHLLGTEVIYLGGQYEIKPVSVSLKRAILNQCTPFINELENNKVKIRFFFEDDCKVLIDKNMFSLIMYNFFSNAVKYTKSDSEIRLNYSSDAKSLDISMISLKMEKSEIVSLSNNGVRGIHAHNISGKGIGLFVIQQALKLMDKNPMYISPNHQNNYSENNCVYNENHFQFLL